MADANPSDDAAPTATDGVAKSVSKKKLIIIIAIPVLLLAIGGGLFVSGVFSKAPAEHADKDKKDGEEAGPSTFYELPDMIVNLSADNTGKQRFLKLSITLELNKSSDEKVVEAVLPRVTDHFQTYLRELRLEDLRGSAGIYRMRQELLDRVRSAADGVEIKDVLFEEILVQ
jgi:flagellar FliL protein